jgi:hypothetical protein
MELDHDASYFIVCCSSCVKYDVHLVQPCVLESLWAYSGPRSLCKAFVNCVIDRPKAWYPNFLIGHMHTLACIHDKKQALFKFLVLGVALRVSGANWEEEEEEEASSCSSNQIPHSINTLEHALIFLKCMVNEYVFMNLVAPNNFFQRF